MAANLPEYPECEKLAIHRLYSEKIEEFVEWLRENKIYLAKYHVHTQYCFEGDDELLGNLECDADENELMQHTIPIRQLIATFFNIDLNRVEEERREMLEKIREENAKRGS